MSGELEIRDRGSSMLAEQARRRAEIARCVRFSLRIFFIWPFHFVDFVVRFPLLKQ